MSPKKPWAPAAADADAGEGYSALVGLARCGVWLEPPAPPRPALARSDAGAWLVPLAGEAWLVPLASGAWLEPPAAGLWGRRALQRSRARESDAGAWLVPPAGEAWLVPLARGAWLEPPAVGLWGLSAANVRCISAANVCWATRSCRVCSDKFCTSPPARWHRLGRARRARRGGECAAAAPRCCCTRPPRPLHAPRRCRGCGMRAPALALRSSAA